MKRAAGKENDFNRLRQGALLAPGGALLLTTIAQNEAHLAAEVGPPQSNIHTT